MIIGNVNNPCLAVRFFSLNKKTMSGHWEILIIESHCTYNNINMLLFFFFIFIVFRDLLLFLQSTTQIPFLLYTCIYCSKEVYFT